MLPRPFKSKFQFFRKMSGVVFRSKRNSRTGNFEWAVEGEDGLDGFYQDVARSAYADMLRDDERNKLYYQALKNVIALKKSSSKNPLHVVDIGTGTGLLSMMAATAGADRVTAIEAFDPVASMARKIIDLNQLSHKIEVISGRSTDIDASEIGEKADIAVAEVFDTELIGENALKTFSDAQKNLLKPGARVIPSKAKFFAQIVQSDELLNWNCAKSLFLPDHGIDLKVPQEIADCPGSDTVHDIQLNQLPLDDFTPVFEPVCVFEFDFEKSICFADQKTLRINVPQNISAKLTKADAVFTWWELDMDGTGQLILSTEPDWSDSRDKVWRDHWIQSVYFLPRSINVQPGCEFWFHACHDEYSFWFSASYENKLTPKIPSVYVKPICSCSLHQILTRNNMARFNDMGRYENFCKAIATKVRGKKCICFGDCSVLPLIAAQLGASEVYSLESDDLCKQAMKKYAASNGVKEAIIMGSMEELPKNTKFDVVLLDPFATSSFLPWHNLHFWHFVEDLRQFQALEDHFEIVPDTAKVMALPVEFENFWKIRAPAGIVEGFDLKPFDAVVQAAIQKSDCQVEPHPLWEYPSKALANPRQLLEIQLIKCMPRAPMKSNVEVDLSSDYKCNAIVIWMEWYSGDILIDTSGLKNRCQNAEEYSLVGTCPKWVKSSKQAVHFLQYPFKTASKLYVDTSLNCETNDADFRFDLK